VCECNRTPTREAHRECRRGQQAGAREREKRDADNKNKTSEKKKMKIYLQILNISSFFAALITINFSVREYVSQITMIRGILGDSSAFS
jgi:hypothetical protein